VSDARLRIISDLHFAEPGSRVRRIACIAPVFEGAEHLVFNGDTLETRYLDLDPKTVEHKAELDAFLAARPGRTTLVTGNHDPNLTESHHLDLEGGAIFVTHGDTLFMEMAPWGWEKEHFRAEQERRLAALPEPHRHTWEARVRVCKEAIMAIRHLSPRAPGGEWKRASGLVQLLRSVKRADWVIRAWRQMPDRAAALAEAFRPQARVVIVGHTHNPGIWERRGRTVINTGSCVPPLGALAVDVCDGRLELRELFWRKGELRVGAVTRTVAVRPAE
jgi:predicted phosphodiesterase